MQENKEPTAGLDDFVERLIEEKGLNSLDDEVLKQLKNDLSSRLEDRINAAILSALPPRKIEDFEKILEQGSADEIQSFCSKNILDLDQLVASELMNFRQTYLTP